MTTGHFITEFCENGIWGHISAEKCHFAIKTAELDKYQNYQDIFDIGFWCGQFWEEAACTGCAGMNRVSWDEVKQTLCNDPAASRADVRKALIKRFAKYDLERGVGTDKEPDFFYNFIEEMWDTFAIAVTYLDIYFK